MTNVIKNTRGDKMLEGTWGDVECGKDHLERAW